MKSTSHNGLSIDPEQGSENNYSCEQLQRAVDEYNSSFGGTVPLELLTAAASTFRSRELMSLLLDRVGANDPVRNWNEFTFRFLETKGI